MCLPSLTLLLGNLKMENKGNTNTYFNAQRGELQKWIPSQMITPHIRQSEKYEEGEF